MTPRPLFIEVWKRNWNPIRILIYLIRILLGLYLNKLYLIGLGFNLLSNPDSFRIRTRASHEHRTPAQALRPTLSAQRSAHATIRARPWLRLGLACAGPGRGFGVCW